MKGIVFNLLEQLVVRDFGEDTWDALLDASGLDGVYTSLVRLRLARGGARDGLQQELVLLEAVVLASNESATVEEALQGAVGAVCVQRSRR